MSTFQELLSQHIASSMHKQQALSSFLGDHGWSVDMGVGAVDFGQGRVYAIQVIGTESQGDGTWLWAWANEESAIPPRLLACAQALRELGAAEGIEELARPELELSQVDGHLLTMAACGVCQADAYYRGSYEGGAAFFLIQGSPLQEPQPASAIEAINVMSLVISQFPVDHKLMARSFLQQQGYSLGKREGKTVASSADGEEISVSFDSLGRISGMETTASPKPTAAPEPRAKKPWWRLGS